jgi:uncharacterized membrane protein YedE/YeeE
MIKPTEPGLWSPYLAGALVGLLAIASVALTGKYLGTSTTFVRATGAIEQRVAPAHTQENAYFQKQGIKLDWQGMLVIGIFFGALASSKLGRTFRAEAVPPMWAERFGPSFGKRAAVAFIGGVIALFGARMANGCPSGNGLSGMMVLSISGLLAMAGFMAGGLPVAALLYRRK